MLWNKQARSSSANVDSLRRRSELWISPRCIPTSKLDIDCGDVAEILRGSLAQRRSTKPRGLQKIEGERTQGLNAGTKV